MTDQLEQDSVELPMIDEPPRSGEWVDAEDAELGGLMPTDEEAEAGRLLGRSIDPDDDEDNGL